MTGAAILALALLLGAVPPTPIPDPCDAFPNKIGYCNESLVRWLPLDTDAFDGWRRNLARLHTRPDPFVILRDGKTIEFPEGTTLERHRFGKETMGVDAVDPVHHIVFVHFGCCAGDFRVLGRTAGPAPVRLPEADLSGVHTRSGIRLGMRAADVISRLGWTKRYVTPGRAGYSYLDYTTQREPLGLSAAGEMYAGGCPYAMLFALKDDRVVSIAFERAC